MARLFVLTIIISSVFISCHSNEIAEGKDVNPEAVYLSYRVSGDEETAIATVQLQFRFGGKNGTTLVLTDPAGVTLDGKQLAVDSSRFNGAYYETMIPVAEFAGKHTIVFTGNDGRQYKEEFDYPVMTFKEELPAQVKRGALNLELNGLNENDRVEVILTDTSYTSKDVARMDTVKNGHIHISDLDMDNLSNGPIVLELIRQENRWMDQAPKEGGRIQISYGLKREFVLE